MRTGLITIVAPRYRNSSAGVRALYKLRDCLQQIHGLEVRMLVDDKLALSGRTGGVVIYPEIYAGNPAGGDLVVRWLLGRHPDSRYTGGDLVFAWPGVDVAHPRLCVNVVELDLFRPLVGERPQLGPVLGYLGKGQLEADPPGGAWPPTADVATWITATDPPTRALLAELLLRGRQLYSWDANSMLNFEAALCGIPSRIWGTRPAVDEFQILSTPQATWDRYNDLVLPAISGDVVALLEAIEAA